MGFYAYDCSLLWLVHVCLIIFFFWFKISRMMVLEHEERASEEPSFLFSKEELWKLCKNKLAHAI